MGGIWYGASLNTRKHTQEHITTEKQLSTRTGDWLSEAEYVPKHEMVIASAVSLKLTAFFAKLRKKDNRPLYAGKRCVMSGLFFLLFFGYY